MQNGTQPPSFPYQVRAGLQPQEATWRVTVSQTSLPLGPAQARKDRKGFLLGDLGFFHLQTQIMPGDGRL